MQVAYGIWTLTVGVVCEAEEREGATALEPDLIANQLKHLAHEGKPLIKSARFNVANTIDA